MCFSNISFYFFEHFVFAIITGYLQVKLPYDLSFRSQVGMEIDTRIYDSFSPNFVIDAAHEYQTYNQVSRDQPMYRNWSIQNTLTYLKTFKERHNVTAMIGNSLEDYHGTGLKGTIQDLPNNSEDMREIDAGTLNPQTHGSSYTNTTMSYFGRLMYNLDNKYYATATYRVDGSSKFLANNKWAAFPSASLAWRISGESFMDKTKKVVDDMKLRVGWGKVGNQNLPAAVYMSKLGQGYYTIGEQVMNTTYPSAVKNEDIRWETVEDYNAGVDFSLFNHKLSGSVEYYVKNTNDMLFQKSYPSYSGYPDDARIWTNVGSMRNKGFEFNVGYNNKVGDFTYGVSVTYTSFNVKMTKLTGDKDPLYGKDGQTRTEEGEAPGYFYGYVADGLFQNQTEINQHTNNSGTFLQPYAQAGDIRFKDINHDGVLDDKDRTKIGSPWADFTGGLNINAAYKHFDFVANFYTSVGNDLVNTLKSTLYNGVEKSNKIDGISNIAWHGEGTSNNIPRLSAVDNNENYTKFSSFSVEDGSFLRMKNIQLGYTLPQVKGFTKVRFYISGQNLLTFTKYGGVDPEVAGDITGFGFGGWGYPIQKTILLGANIQF